jgi:4-hydroxy-tetrahydrodipicolinate reductase
MLKVALIGYGNMGKMIHEMSKPMPMEIVSIIDPAQEGCAREINAESLKDADVCIEFSHPSVVLENIRQVCLHKRNLVVGTTGWFDNLPEVQKLVEQSQNGVIYGSNLSIGMNLFYEVVANAAKIFAKYDEYDVYGLELHHRQKADSPSGTAKELGKILLNELKSKSQMQYEKVDGKIITEDLHFASVRAGHIPGTHTIGFDSEADSIELTHRARNRRGFALGALKAALWIDGKKGLYSFQEFIRENSL